MYNRAYFEQLDHKSLLESIILNALKENEIDVGFGNDFDGENYSCIDLGEVDNNQTLPALHCYGPEKFGLSISYYDENTESYEDYKKLLDKEDLSIIPEGLCSFMLKVLETQKAVLVSLEKLLF